MKLTLTAFLRRFDVSQVGYVGRTTLEKRNNGRKSIEYDQ